MRAKERRMRSGLENIAVIPQLAIHNMSPMNSLRAATSVLDVQASISIPSSKLMSKLVFDTFLVPQSFSWGTLTKFGGSLDAHYAAPCGSAI